MDLTCPELSDDDVVGEEPRVMSGVERGERATEDCLATPDDNGGEVRSCRPFGIPS